MRERLEKLARDIRRDILRISLNSGTKGAHLGGAMSSADILAVLYGEIMHYDVDAPDADDRDRFVMSKAHAAIGQYAAMHCVGLLQDKEIESAMQRDSFLFKHPKMDVGRGFEFSGGSLGHGLSLAVGSAIGMTLRGNHTSRSYVLLGDGECDEGSVWEAAASVVHFDLRQITVIVDRNGLQNDGPTDQVMSLGDLAQRFHGLGFEVIETDGHDVMALRDAFLRQTKRPKLLLANTIKGKGVSFAENVTEWHIAYLTQELYDRAMEELVDA